MLLVTLMMAFSCSSASVIHVSEPADKTTGPQDWNAAIVNVIN